MFFRRGRSGKDDPWVAEKIVVFTAGAMVTLVGMLLDNPWLMGSAAVLLLGGVLLRFVPRGPDEEDETGPSPGDGDPSRARDGGTAGGGLPE